ncbi:MAG: DinB family protein, partial [Dehalococcoidia bacterium]
MDGTELADELTRARADLIRASDGMAASQFRLRPHDEEWSIVEVLAHLIDVDHHWLGQALAIHQEPDHVFVHFDDDRWKREHAGMREMPVAEVMRALEQSHRAVIESLASMSTAVLARAGRHPRGEPYTVADVFRRYVAHDRAHTEQIASIRRRLGG